MMKSLYIALAMFLLPESLLARVQVMGPYRHQIQKTIIENHGGQAAALMIDYHEVMGCSGDANYKQSLIAPNTWYIEISPFKDPNANCSSPQLVKVGSIVELEKLDADQAIVVWINDLRDYPDFRPLIVMDTQGNDLANVSSKDQWTQVSMVKFFDYDSYAFSVKWEVPGISSPKSGYHTFKLDFTYGGAEVYESENRLVLINLNDASNGSLSFAPGDLGNFRNITVLIELPAGIDAKSFHFTVN